MVPCCDSITTPPSATFTGTGAHVRSPENSALLPLRWRDAIVSIPHALPFSVSVVPTFAPAPAFRLFSSRAAAAMADARAAAVSLVGLMYSFLLLDSVFFLVATAARWLAFLHGALVVRAV